MPDQDNSAFPPQEHLMQSMLDWQKAYAGLYVQAQQNQFQVLATWQKAMQEAQRDLWDRWICRFGGGIPLDG